LAQQNIYIRNKPATFEFAIEDKLKAGIVLTGSEIKSIRNSRVSFNDSFCIIYKGEIWIRNLYIGDYANAGYAGHANTRERKLLLTKKELRKWESKIKEKGFTIVPLSIFITNEGYAKLDIGLGRGKKLYDKRESIKNREADRDLKRHLK
jgi:SsrA-binding protein